MLIVIAVLTWIHLLCMIGAFGGLLAVQTAVPRALRNSAEVARGISRIGNILIGIGFLAGIGLYGAMAGHARGGQFNGVIAVKFILLLAVAALLGMSKKPGKGDLFRNVCLALLAVAALAGTSLRFGV